MSFDRINNLMADMVRDISRIEQDAALKRIKADPEGHKLTRLMAAGKAANWRYYPAGKDGRGREVRFAWAVYRNAAGYFLGWRELVLKDGSIQRDQFFARKVKKQVIDLQRRKVRQFKAERGTST